MGETNSAAAAAHLEAARKDLLDLTFRNPLLNYRLLKARGLEVIETSPTEIYQSLVKGGKKLRFAPSAEKKPIAEATTEEEHDEPALTVIEADEPLNVEAFAELPEPEPAPKPNKSSLELQTPHPAADLQKRLLNTYYTARTFLEEQGINTLYLALGMLHWYEDDSSQQAHQSPLILVPVALERGEAGDSFSMKYHEQEVGENTSLAALLQNEHGIKLPSLSGIDDEDLEVDSYFGEITALISRKKRWTVDPSAVALGFFSFSKYQMYKDLETAAWPGERQPSDHPLLQSLLGNGFHDGPSEIPDDVNLDTLVQVADTNTVMDADSSQSIAILDVLSGRNLVIQGPPGTGKSQTITNIIAESLAAGKRILFVAEKMAALDVVKDRLSRLELGSACLELHSNKSNKKQVLQDLQRTLNLNQPVLGTRDDDAMLLQSAQDRLNLYADTVNAPVGKSGMMVQAVLGEHLALESSAQDPQSRRMAIEDAAAWTAVEYRQKASQVLALQAHLDRMGPPAEHLFWGAERRIRVPAETEQICATCVLAQDKTTNLHTYADELAAQLPLDMPVRIGDAAMIAHFLRRALEAPRLDGILLTSPLWTTRRAEIDGLLDLGQKVNTGRATCERTFRADALGTDVQALYQTIQETGPQWWHLVNSRWRESQKTFKSLCQGTNTPTSTEAQLQALRNLIEYQTADAEFEKKQSLGSELFGTQWQGRGSNWAALKTLTAWIAGLKKEIHDGTLPGSIIDFLAGNPDLSHFKPQLVRLERLISDAKTAGAAVVEALVLNEAQRFGSEAKLTDQSFDELISLLDKWAGSPEKLSEMAQYNYLAEECQNSGLTIVVTAAANPEGDAPGDLGASFRRSYIWSLMQTAFAEHPGLANFSGTSHEQLIREFCELDVKHLKNSRAKIARVHWENLPSKDGGGQLRLLAREFEKKSRHLPLRKLLIDAGRAIQAIKPVFMMSPLSVATYLAPGVLEFDLVIFDEASQVRPVDAFGALLRGSQAVVVGDSKQLPPTSFFDTITSSDQVEEENLTSDLESVLGMFVAQGAPERMLKWHYRSRHESLIAVSNQEFYDNSLVIFPSPDSARLNYGLHYHHLPETIYDRGKSGTNRAEAKTVAEYVMAHAKRQIVLPESEWQSLGVAAFSMNQMQAILDEVEMLRRQTPECEPFFAPARHEPFFVKNLENVQGDERDVIYISVGYGRDAAGKVSMNFGPLNGDGGARRLNVLITRAKLRCEVFTNLTADDIDLTSTSSAGLKAFKHFLQYAQTGHLAMAAPTGREPDSPFEQEVIRRLRSLGYEVEPQVGCAGYFIDIAVKDPEQPGRYLIGIECDGRTYHSAKSARDRDRLREQVLRGQGWQLHHIWSTDWIKQPAEETRRLQAVIERVRAETDYTAESVASPPDIISESPVLASAETVIRIAAEREAKTIPAYVCAPLEQPSRIGGGHYPPDVMADLVTQIVAVESPVHIEEMIRRIVDYAGVGRVTDKLRNAVSTAAGLAIQNGRIRVTGKFCWSPEMQTPPIRNRDLLPSASRKLEYVAPEEIQEAIKHVLKTSYGMSQDELPRAVVHLLLGLERLSQENRDTILQEVQHLEEADIVTLNEGQITLNG